MSPDAPARPLKVFISSTYEDLRPYVLVAEAVLREEQFEFDQFKHWEATGRPSVSECKERVEACDCLVVLVGGIYGWVPPPAQGGDGRSSITRLEVGWALEKPMPVLSFFVQESGETSGSPPPMHDERLGEFLAELQKNLGKPVSSPETFRDALRHSLVSLDRGYHRAATTIPAQVGEAAQGRYQEFRDREDHRDVLFATLSSSRFRAATVVGKGGFGKSALANYTIDELRRGGHVDTVIYLSSARQVPIDGFRVYMSTLEASGQPKVVYEGSWARLSASPQRLIDVLLNVYRQHRILVLLDALEHNISDDGEIEPPILRSFIEGFLLAEHPSKLLITTREPPALSASETGVVQEIHLDRGLPVSDSVSLLVSQLSAAASLSPERVEAAVRAVHGIPFAVERLAYLMRKNPLLDLGQALAFEDVLDRFVQLAHSTLTSHARMTLQARSVFDEPVPADALAFVLAPEVATDDVESAIVELGRGHFLFPVGSSGLLGIHEFDQDSSYRSLVHDGILDVRQLHRRAADYYARSCTERLRWFDWTSYDELKNDIKRFKQLVRSGDPVAAANVFSISKVEFLNWTGHVDEVLAMFMDLDLREEKTRASLIKKFALADALVVAGPFDNASSELKSVIELAQSLGEADAELSATYQLGLAFRYAGRGDDAVGAMHSMIEKLRERGEARWVAYSLYGDSLACTYAGRYLEAVQSGKEQVRYGRRTGETYFVGRGNSSLCIPYYVVGRMQDARRCAKASAEEFVNTANEYMVGFIENVHGLALQALGESGAAIQAFDRARAVGKRTGQRRVEGLAAANWSWVLYSQGDIENAAVQIAEAVRVFAGISEPDARLAHHLREAFEYALDGDQEQEAEALGNFVRSDYVNPDLIRGVAVAERIVSLGSRVTAKARQAAESFLTETRIRLDGIIAELKD